jgi:threonine/homoserine/homoserine lactone efflux protein
MSPLLQGTMIGFAIAAPVGPIGLLCIRRSLNDGRVAGFVSGLGAASADAVYGVIAVSGVTAITSVLLEYRSVLQLLGAVFLVYLGVSIIRTPQVQSTAEGKNSPSLLAAYASTFGLTLANPATILSFIGIFAGIGLATENGPALYPALLLVAGVFLGSAIASRSTDYGGSISSLEACSSLWRSGNLPWSRAKRRERSRRRRRLNAAGDWATSKRFVILNGVKLPNEATGFSSSGR